MSALDGFSIPHTVLRYFDLTSSSYTDASIRDIAERRRKYPDSLLFLDQLLGLASVDVLYPPTSPADLRRLLHTIRSAVIHGLNQACLIYYLLLDADHASAPEVNGDSHRLNGHLANGEMMRLDKGKGKAKEPVGNAEDFARRRCLPGVWRGFIRGYWALDHGKWEDAVESLSNPAITSLNFLPEIFTLISTHVSPPAHALSLAHSLFTALSPQLESEPMIQLRVLSLASASSLSDAFSFIRSQAPDTRRGLREVIYRWALGSSSRIPSGRGPPSVQPIVLTSLLHLPLDTDESAHLTHFLTHPPRSIPPPALDLLHELVTVRLIHQGQYAECLALDKQLAGSGVGKEEDRQKRRDRVKEFISILPEAQRRVLELDGELRREDERRRIEGNGDIDMSSGAGPSNGAQLIAGPSPIRPRAPFSLSQMTNTPASPAARAIQPQTRHVSSPFSGPPQFARTDSPGLGIGTPGTPTRSAAPTARLASGSPFNLPPRVAQLEVPRPVRRIIDDDAEEEARGRKMDQKRRAEEGDVGTPTPAAKEKEAESAHEAEAEPIPRNGDEEADKEGDDVNLAEPAEPTPQPQPNGSDSAAEMPPPPIPQPKTPARKSSRQTLAPASKPTTSKRQTPPPPTSVSGRSSRRQTTVPPDEPAPAPASERGTESVDESRPSRKGKSKSKADEAKEESEDKAYPMPGAFTNPDPTPRSRLTRSASRAVLDDEQPNPGSPAKRPRTRTATTTQQGKSQRAGSPTESERSVRRATRELSVASSAGGGRRETRASVTPGPGPRGGSPTGSVKSVASTRSRREGTARGREGSITPRVTRTKK